MIVHSVSFNSSHPSAAHIRQRIRPALVQVMACHLFGAKPLPKPMLIYCQFDSWEQISVKLKSEFDHIQSRKCIWNRRPFFPGKDESMICSHTKSAQRPAICRIKWVWRRIIFQCPIALVCINTMVHEHNGTHFAGNFFTCIYVQEMCLYFT